MSRAKRASYWIATGLLAFFIGTGGAAEAIHAPGNIEGIVQRLGYPVYFLTIVGVWKVLGAVVILIPRTPRLKEWAYAGIFFNVTGAAYSHAAVGDYGPGAFHVVVNLALAGLTLISWALRPATRVVGEVVGLPPQNAMA